MITIAKYADTPAIVQNDITAVSVGKTLKYADLTGREKRDYLFDQGIGPTAYANHPDEARPDVVSGLVQFAKSAFDSIANHLLSESLTRVSDELEKPKPKLFHTYGTTAKVRFIPEPGTAYTGILSEPVPALARFSYAGPIIGVGVVPGLGLKCFVDGDHPSENLVAMRQLDRQQPVWRFFSPHSNNSVFQNPFTNILPVPSFLNLVRREMKRRFETVVEDGKGLHQPLENLACVHANGDLVAAAQAVAPYRVIFRPTPQATAASDASIEFRDDLAQNIRSGITIYEVFALDEAEERELNGKGVVRVEDLLAHGRKIGTITTESEFIASKYGDYRLFFKHNARYIRSEFKK